MNLKHVSKDVLNMHHARYFDYQQYLVDGMLGHGHPAEQSLGVAGGPLAAGRVARGAQQLAHRVHVRHVPAAAARRVAAVAEVGDQQPLPHLDQSEASIVIT